MTRPPIKLLTLWHGPLPPWMDRFADRVRANRLVDWELLAVTNVRHYNLLASLVSGVPCVKSTPYALCDLRPLFGQMFADRYAGYDWWGWCDLDVVFGDLDRLLPPLLEKYDVISGEPYSLAGPFTILRNTPATTTLYRRGDFQEVLSDPEYANFDEDGFAPPGGTNANPSFTRIAKASGLRLRLDDRSWAETQQMLASGVPSRCCEFKGNRLVEVPTGRELLLYHFTAAPKQWPLPNRHADRADEQSDCIRRERETPRPDEPPPEESPAYWSARVKRVLASGAPVHAAVMDTGVESWEAHQRHAAAVLRRHVREGMRVLDAGCGYGALAPTLRELQARYTGVDYCEDMVLLARLHHQLADVHLADIAELPFADDAFDLVVCRGVEGSTRTLVSNRKWRTMHAEMLRVAPVVVLLDSGRGVRVVKRA